MCECYKVGGPWVDYDPNCPVHGDEAQRIQEQERQEKEETRHREESLEERVSSLEDTVKKLHEIITRQNIVIETMAEILRQNPNA